MLGKGAHVLHDQLWLTKHLRVDALKDEVLFYCGIQGDQKGVIDIAVPKYLDVHDLALGGKLIGNGNKIVQGFAACV